MNTEDPNGNNEGPVVVVGATGQQGSAVVAALLEAGARVRAVVRDPASDRARSLARDGAELVRGDLDREDSLVAAFAGAGTVFAMTTFTGPDGPAGEVAHGRAFGDAARRAGVTHVVYSSVGGAERSTGIPHFESKRRVEEYLQTLDFRTTFVRPTFFMDNFASFSKPELEDGMVVLRLPLPAGVPLQMVAVRDVGRVAALAALQPDRIPGGAVEIAGDELNGEEIAAALGEASGRPARYEEVPVDALPSEDQQAMFTWFAHVPAYRADLELTRELVADLLDLRGWLSKR